MTKLDNFMSMMTRQATIASGQKVVERKALERVHFGQEAAHGTYQIIPFNNPVTDYPYVTMFDTKEVNIPFVQTENGQQVEKQNWHKILPKDVYIMKDPSGRVVESLSAADSQLYDTVEKAWREVNAALGGYKKQADRTPAEDKRRSQYVRTKNYTIFNGYCVNRAGDGGRGTVREKFCALFIVPAKGFMTAVSNNMNQVTAFEQNNTTDWIANIYNDDMNSRMGSIILSISRTPTQPSYNVTVSHKCIPNGGAPIQISMSDEDKAYMSNSPIENFLGKLAPENPKSTSPADKRLFNRAEYEKILDALMKILASVTATNSVSQAQAVAATNQLAMQNIQQPISGSADPMLQQMVNDPSANGVQQRIIANNTNPTVNPPAAHNDPITSAPVNSGFSGGVNFGTATPGFQVPQGLNVNTSAMPQGDDLPF